MIVLDTFVEWLIKTYPLVGVLFGMLYGVDKGRDLYSRAFYPVTGMVIWPYYAAKMIIEHKKQTGDTE